MKYRRAQARPQGRRAGRKERGKNKTKKHEGQKNRTTEAEKEMKKEK